MMMRFINWLSGGTDEGIDPLAMLAAMAIGAALGVLIGTMRENRALLEDLYILAHEQKRLTIAASMREYAAATTTTTMNTHTDEGKPDA